MGGTLSCCARSILCVLSGVVVLCYVGTRRTYSCTFVGTLVKQLGRPMWDCSVLPVATSTRKTASVHRGMSPPDETEHNVPQPTASYRHEIRQSGWVHGRVAACASDLLLVGSLHTHGMWFLQREIVANLREQGHHRLREVVNVPHNCLVTVSVAMHTGQLWIARSLRIQGLPLPRHHLKLTRHVSYVCGAVVRHSTLDRSGGAVPPRRIHRNCGCWAHPSKATC